MPLVTENSTVNDVGPSDLIVALAQQPQPPSSIIHQPSVQELIKHPLDQPLLPPSAKALGKRPERVLSSIPLAPSPLNPKSKSKPNGKAGTGDDKEQKRRVMPVRSRRGGGGIVGSSAVDVMILESQQRTAEHHWIVAPTATFLLTTDSTLVPPPPHASTSTSSHFEKAEVKMATRIQEMIQTPEFSLLPETSAVGSRLRVRGSDDGGVDTSDAAYERRHRKYETFEKRQRRREKEKLQHEQYKLKERLDELRSMDVSAFAMGGLSLADAEVKKKGMLQEAEDLDRRYAVLLPSEKKHVGGSVGGKGKKYDIGDIDDLDSLASLDTEPKIRLRIRRGTRNHQAESTPVEFEEKEEPLVDDTVVKEEEDGAAGEPVMSEEEPEEYVDVPQRKPTPPRKTRGQPAHKRLRLSDGAGEYEERSRPTRQPTRPSGYIPDILKHAPKPNANRAVLANLRRAMPFNVKMAASVDQDIDFELPSWVMEGISRRGEEDKISVDENAEDA